MARTLEGLLAKRNIRHNSAIHLPSYFLFPCSRSVKFLTQSKHLFWQPRAMLKSWQVGEKLAQSKLSRMLKNDYVKTAILGVIIIGGVFAFWFGLRVALRTEYPLLAVASGSMVPTLNIGDLIVVQGVPDPNEIVVAPAPNGTVIVFHKPGDPNYLIVHRAINKFENNGEWYFQTKGDANSFRDSWDVPYELIVGKVVGVVPWVGSVPLFLRTSTGIFLIVVLFIIVVLAEYIPVILKKNGSETKALS